MRIQRHLLAFLLGAALLLGFAAVPAIAGAPDASAAAPATSTAQQTQTVTGGILPMATDEEVNEKFVRNGYLPINRWFMSTSVFHDKFGEFITDQISEKMQRHWTQAFGMMLGNTMWFLTGEVTRSAVDFDVLNVAGAAVDKATGQLGQAITATPAIAGGIAVAVLAIALVGAARRRGPGAGVAAAKKVAALFVIFALVGVSSAAALNSRTVGDEFKPATGSPGWIVKSVSDSISNLAATPATVFTTMLGNVGGVNQVGVRTEPFSCSNYLDGMSQRVSKAATQDISAVTEIINGIWRITGVETWKIAQFGAENDYADYMYCRALEMNSTVSTPASRQTVTKLGAGLKVGAGTGHLTGVTPAKTPVLNPLNKNDRDVSLIAWAACRPRSATPSSSSDWSLAPGWGSVKDPAITSGNCHAWWTATNGDDLPDEFDFGSSREDIQKRTDNAQVQNFVYALHGNDVMAGTTAVTSYQVSAGLMLIIFGGLSLLVMGAKIFMIVFMVTVFVVMIASLFSRNAAGEKLAKLANHFLGVAVFSFGMTLILSVIALLTKVLIDFGTAMWGAGNPIALIWSGAAPVIACILLHMMFTKVLKLPSPMTPAGAFGWGAAGAVAGVALTKGVGSMVGRTARNAGRAAGRRAMDGVTDGAFSYLTGRRSSAGGRRHTMDGGLRRGDTEATSMGGAPVAAPLSKKEQKTARKKELAEARKWQLENNPQEANALRRGLSAAGSGLAGLSARAGSSARVLAARTGKVATGTWKSVDGYLSSDVAGRKALRQARFGTPAERAARRAEITESMQGHLQTGLAALNSARSRTTETLRGLPSAGADAARRAPTVIGQAFVGARDAAVTAGETVARETRGAASTARLLAQYAKENPAEAANRVSVAAWNGTKRAASTVGQGAAAAGRGAATAVQVGGQAAAKVAQAATSKPVRETAKYTVAGLAAVSGPAGTVGAAGFLISKARKASKRRREHDESLLTAYREHQAKQQAPQQQQAPQPGTKDG